MAEIGRIEWIVNDEAPMLAMVGEFDLSNASIIVGCFDDLADAGCTRVIVDMSATSFIDSTILGAFALAYQRGLILAIRGASGAARRELERSGLSAVFDIS
jgi:anti-anti-sigma factor